VLKEIYDIGSGGGFPGIVMAILRPQWKMILIEKDPKKCEYLSHLSKHLGLSNVEIRCTGIESLKPGSIECAVTRGFSSLPKSLLIFRKLVKKGGKVFHLKSEEWASELADIPTQLCSFWLPSLLGDYKLPLGEVKFAVVKTEKIAD
jgi:16S rRNA (guanine527-N7)-methyltransferase